MTPPDTATAAVVTPAGEARVIESFHTMRVLLETPGLSVLDTVAERGQEPPMHVHEREDETFLVTEGRVTVWVGDEVVDAPAGSCLMLPRGVPHTFAVEGERARMLVICTPGGFEGMFDAVPAPPDMAVAQAAFDRFGIRVTGPHPRAS
jgi:quercetin dioxygenase-like cupin family protein